MYLLFSIAYCMLKADTPILRNNFSLLIIILDVTKVCNSPLASTCNCVDYFFQIKGHIMWLLIDQASIRLGISRRTIQRKVSRQTIRSKKNGNRRYVWVDPLFLRKS